MWAASTRSSAALGPTAVPVPEAFGLCDDPSVNGSPFYVMSFVDGIVVRDVEVGRRLTSPETRAVMGKSLVDVLADLHRVDPDEVGLGDLGRKEGYIERQLKRWSTQFEASTTRDLPLVKEVHRRLAAAVPEQGPATIAHGDYRLDNCMCKREGPLAAVLDWELCTLGDPMADLGMLTICWTQEGDTRTARPDSATQLPGFPTRDEMVARYVERTGRDVSDLPYYCRVPVLAAGLHLRRRVRRATPPGRWATSATSTSICSRRARRGSPPLLPRSSTTADRQPKQPRSAPRRIAFTTSTTTGPSRSTLSHACWPSASLRVRSPSKASTPGPTHSTASPGAIFFARSTDTVANAPGASGTTRLAAGSEPDRDGRRVARMDHPCEPAHPERADTGLRHDRRRQPLGLEQEHRTDEPPSEEHGIDQREVAAFVLDLEMDDRRQPSRPRRCDTAPVASMPAAAPASVGSTSSGKTLFVPVEIGITGTDGHPRATARFVPSPPSTMTAAHPISPIARAAAIVSRTS